ncbi:hypothetical protein [Bacterioplanoides sp.]
MDAATVATITSAVDFSTIQTGIGTVAAAVGLIYVATRGARMLLGMVRS